MAARTISIWGFTSLMATGALLQAQSTITTIAGNGNAGFSGDGGPAISASFNQPVYVVLDAGGNLIIADSMNHRVRKVSPSGVVTTVAGTGTAGFSGDGGAATQAALNQPLGLCLDETGNLYVADVANNRIRRVTPAGTISTVAGNGTRAAGGNGGAAVNSPLFIGIRCAVDRSGNLYIAEQGSHRIRVVSPNGVINTAAGLGSRGFSGDGGAAGSATLDNPTAVATDQDGNIYFSDQSNHRIRKVTTAGIITTIGGSGTAGFSGDEGPATAARLNFPGGLVVDTNGDVYFADDENFRIRRISASGTITTVAGNGTRGFSGDGGDAINASMNGQFGVALDPAGNLYFGDTLNHRVRRVTGVSSAGPVPSFSLSGLTPGTVTTIMGRNLSVNVSGTVTASQVPLPTQLSGVSVAVDGIAAPLVAVTNSGGQEELQIQAPFEISGRETVQVIVNSGRATNNAITVPVLPSRPSIVTVDGIFASVVRADGTAVTPLNPASAGEKLTFLCRGLGTVDPPATTGSQSSSDPLSRTVALPEMSIGGQTLAVEFSGLAPGFIGLYRVEATVPGGVPAGIADVIVTMNGISGASAKLATR